MQSYSAAPGASRPRTSPLKRFGAGRPKHANSVCAAGNAVSSTSKPETEPPSVAQQSKMPADPQHGSKTRDPTPTRARLAMTRQSSGSSVTAVADARRFSASFESTPLKFRRLPDNAGARPHCAAAGPAAVRSATWNAPKRSLSRTQPSPAQTPSSNQPFVPRLDSSAAFHSSGLKSSRSSKSGRGSWWSSSARSRRVSPASKRRAAAWMPESKRLRSSALK
mmetsp:Transcript_19345/g.66310  ORF Transcript_19345/g.66310 Transcript_19345/m.66310 type:complete len:222 (+) Transcript_19345:506-1171(+)